MTRMPEQFSEHQGEELMSNFDGIISQITLEAIKGKELFSRYPGQNFNGKVWWQDDKWRCEVWCYGTLNEIVVCDSPQQIMTEVCNKYGHK